MSPLSVVTVGSREVHGHADYRAVDTSHLGDRIEDGIVNIVAGVTDPGLQKRNFDILAPSACR